jgi:transcriptional regulator NrdR family protein
MGVSCCVRELNKNDDLDNCQTISDIRDFLSNKLDLAELEQEEIGIYKDDKNKTPTTIEVVGLSDEDLNKRILYLNEMKDCINNIDDQLKNNQDLDVEDIKNAIKEFNVMYSYIYDDSKRYMKWFSVFKNFTESKRAKN